MVFDFKKEYKEFYLQSQTPRIVEIPAMSFIAVRGVGDPNEEGGAYKQAVGVLYAIAYTIRMSYKGDHEIEGFFPYVVPPLEGFWWQEGVKGVNSEAKDTFNWISVIRLPDFVTQEVYNWAVSEAAHKKTVDCSKAEFLFVREGTCAQIMHVGPYDDEPATVAEMDAYADEQGFELDFSDTRFHHEIYLSDPRKTDPSKCKTILRHPVKRVEQCIEKPR